jgi:Putative peptidoglycan binding domain
MKKMPYLIFRKLATISFVIFAVSAVSPAAHARPKGAMMSSNHSDRDHRYFHGRHHFGFPYWWYFGYRYDYAYDDSESGYDARYWQDLATKVQSELARRGYYQGQINGVIDSTSRQAIRAFQKAQGLPETGLIDPGVLRSLKLSVP